MIVIQFAPIVFWYRFYLKSKNIIIILQAKNIFKNIKMLST